MTAFARTSRPSLKCTSMRLQGLIKWLEIMKIQMRHVVDNKGSGSFSVCNHTLCLVIAVSSSGAVAAAAKSLQLCPTLCNPIDGSPPGSPVPGILQARTLEWVAISFSNAWKWKVKVKSLSCVWLFANPWTAAHQAPLSMGFSRWEYWSGVPLASLGLYASLPTWFALISSMLGGVVKLKLWKVFAHLGLFYYLSPCYEKNRS